MTAALTPELAIAYVRELSADVRAAVVLAADGSLLAGRDALAAPARAYLAAAGDRLDDVVTRVADGLVLAARTPGHAVVVAAGPLSLVGPTALDARTAAEALAPATPRAAAPAGTSDRTRPDTGLQGSAAPAPAPGDDTVTGAPTAIASPQARAAAEALISATQRAI